MMNQNSNSNTATASAAKPTRLRRGSSEKYAKTSQFKANVRKGINIATYNVRSLKEGYLELLEIDLEKYTWDIIGLSETRWLKSGEITTKNGHTFIWSGNDTFKQHGVGLLINKSIKKSILEYKAISERIIKIRIAAKPENLCILQIYAPTSTADTETIDEWYNQLEQVIRDIPKKDVKIIQGDWNAKLGEESKSDFNNLMGRYSNRETNERGKDMLEFMSRWNLYACNTKFKHKPSRIYTWYSPDNYSRNQIDYILIAVRWQKFVSRCRVLNGIDVGSDHRMVMMTIKFRDSGKHQKNCPTPKFNPIDLMKKREDIRAEMLRNLESTELNLNNINTMEYQIAEILIKSAKSHIRRTRYKKHPWISDRTIAMAEERHRARKSKDNTRRNQISRMIDKQVKEDKNKWVLKQCEEIDSDIKANRTKQAYDAIKLLTTEKSQSSSAINDKNGNILVQPNKVLERWKEYCSNLYKIGRPIANPLHGKNIQHMVINHTAPTLSEVKAAVKSLKNNKSPGNDCVQGELIKMAPDQVIDAYHQLCVKIWESGEWPDRWCQSTVIPIHKKNSKLECNNYRTISLISHPSKILLKIILNRLQQNMKEIIEENQAGFQKGRGTVEQIFVINQIIEKFLEMDRKVYHVFIDFQKAFDSVRHDILWSVLSIQGVPSNTITLLKNLYEKNECSVRVNGKTSEPFHPELGVRQGCIISPILFNAFLQCIIDESEINVNRKGVQIQGRSINYLAYADDIDILSDSEVHCQEQLTQLWEKAAEFGLMVSDTKTECMVTSKGTGININIRNPSNGSIKQVQTFKYLGQHMISTGRNDTEIHKRCNAATVAFNKLTTLWNTKNINVKIKIKILHSLVYSILLYGCETWTLSTKTLTRLNAFEMKTYRRILNISYRQRITNLEVRDRISSLTKNLKRLTTIVIQRQLKWYGHVTRMNGERTPRVALFGLVEGDRPRGRPRDTWTKQLLSLARIERCDARKLAQDRQKWRTFTANCDP